MDLKSPTWIPSPNLKKVLFTFLWTSFRYREGEIILECENATQIVLEKKAFLLKFL
jgi:hypothetical protein